MPDPTRTNFASGNSSLASVTATFGFTATAGRLLVMSVFSETTMSTPAGWTVPTGCSQVSARGHYLLYKIAAGGETSVALTMGSADAMAWVLCEFDNVETSSSLDTSNGQLTDSAGTTYTTPTLTPSTGRRFIVAAIAGARDDESLAGIGTWTNSYAEQAESLYTATSNFSLNVGMATLAMDGTGSATTSTGITFDSGVAAQYRYSNIAAFKVSGGSSQSQAPRSMHMARMRRGT